MRDPPAGAGDVGSIPDPERVYVRTALEGSLPPPPQEARAQTKDKAQPEINK